METRTSLVLFEENKIAALEVWSRNRSGLFIGMVQTKHSFWCCLSQTNWLGQLFMCYMHQFWNETGCLRQLCQGSFTMLGWGSLWFHRLGNFSYWGSWWYTKNYPYNEWQRIEVMKTGRVRHCRGKRKSAGKFLSKRSYYNWKGNWSKKCYCWKITLS